MILFRLPMTMCLLGAALVLLAWGALSKKGHVLSFLGGMCAVLSILMGLIGGAALQEVLIYILAALVCVCAAERVRGNRE